SEESSAPVAAQTGAPATRDVMPAAMMQEEPACELTQLERMLQDHCGLCHGAPGFSQWIDCLGTCSIVPVTFAELIDARMLVPGDGEGSRLFRRLRDDSMPPPSAQLEA